MTQDPVAVESAGLSMLPWPATSPVALMRRPGSLVMCCRASCPDTGLGLSLYGDALVRTGQLEEAVNVFLKTVELAPDDWTPGDRWVASTLPSIDQKEPVTLFFGPRSCIKTTAELWSNLGVIERKLGKSESATRCYQRAISTDPSYAPAWRNLAMFGEMPRTGTTRSVATSASSSSAQRMRVIG